jgi:hypothetical protein
VLRTLTVRRSAQPVGGAHLKAPCLAVLACAGSLLAAGCSNGQGAQGQARDRLLAQWSREGVHPVTAPNPDGSQSIAVLASNGYYPLSDRAKAGVPSVLRIYTSNTYDCSRAFLLPQGRVRRLLAPSGVTEVAIPAQEKGSTLFGTCAMGMYTFTITFE